MSAELKPLIATLETFDETMLAMIRETPVAKQLVKLLATRAPEPLLVQVREALEEQITHAKTRIADGVEMGATVWRIALDDIVRENTALLTRLDAARE